MLSVMGAFAEFERSLIRECQKEGSPWPSSAQPTKSGKTLTPEQAAELALHDDSVVPKAGLARDYGISSETCSSTGATPSWGESPCSHGKYAVGGRLQLDGR
jgi:DNA invertase Pin-like site-specific DNA recombinase